MDTNRTATFRATQIFGLCFYLAWMYLVFNGTASINVNLRTGWVLLWVHIVSSVFSVSTYLLIILFSRAAVKRFATRWSLVIAGVIMAAGTALSTVPVAIPDVAQLAGAALTGVASCWIIVYWGSLFSSLTPRNIIVCTAASFFFAFLIYYGSMQLPYVARYGVEIVLPLAASLLLPRASNVSAVLGGPNPLLAETPDEQARLTIEGKGGEEAGGRMLVPLRDLPWRIGVGLLIVMFVYGGVRVYVGMADYQESDALLPTLLMSVGVTVVAALWGLFFTKGTVSLGAAYKMALPFLATTLLVLDIFGYQSAALVASLATACDVTIEMLSWILLADIARTTRVPAFLVFAIGRGAVQLGMFAGQLLAMGLIDQRAPFAIISVFVLMIAAGFLFTDQDTELVFQAPSQQERAALEQKTGAPFETRLDTVARQVGLTPRETEIFKLWATGHGSKYIQETYVISAATVKTHVRHIYEKCGVHSRAEIISLLEEGE
ncbi:helix-turn-helix transcriptional regulator [Curtanaerobium respiraculi]|uniref:helix-turn-helix transcriptional regulator n=1 Tax=Curtanaerobium respiraculi TaxID=2949669 RepID=UPI0024B33D53|nr:LuxR C-terminal-related transcriptional regulator [Curtanaerobium respiraculi]